MLSQLNFSKLRVVNLRRCHRWHPEGINSWTLSDWAVAMAGEAGEACNVIKKINREAGHLKGNKSCEAEDVLFAKLADELTDTVIYIDLLAAAAEIDLGAAIRKKFNAVSDRLDFPEKL